MTALAETSRAELRRDVRSFIADELSEERWRPRPDAWMAAFDPSFSQRLAERGWLGMTWPAEYGGHERSSLDRYVVTEELLAVGAPVAAHWFADRQTGPMLLHHGTEDQRRAFLPGMARGEIFFAIGMSEPDSGSDLASVRTKADRDEGGWRVSGTKVWTSHAHECHYMVALCRTSPSDPERRHAGLSQVIIDLASTGVEVRPIYSMSGEHHFNEVILDDVFVPDAAVVGNVGDGWHQVTSELAYERSGPERFLSTMPVLEALVDRLSLDCDDGVAAKVGSLIARLAALRAQSEAVAEQLQRGESPATEAALVKDLGARFEREVIATARELVVVEPELDSDAPLARTLAEAVLSSPGATLRGGTTEILRSIIARSLVTR